MLRSLDVSTVVIAGTMTNFCCGATAREAYWRGFKVIFGSDITATDDDDMHEAELRTLRRGFGADDGLAARSSGGWPGGPLRPLSPPAEPRGRQEVADGIRTAHSAMRGPAAGG